MRTVILLLIILQNTFLCAQHYCSKSCQAKEGFIPQRVFVSSQQLEDITYLRARWEINPEQRYIAGSVQYAFKVISNTYDSLKLDLSDSLRVDSIVFRGENAAFHHQNEILSIALAGIAANDTASLTIFYRGAPTSSGFGSFVQTNTPYGKPIVWTLSQPFGASDWWPCKEGFEDKIDSSDYYINIPMGNRAAGMGLLAGIDTVGNRQIYHWKHRYPIATYLVALAVTDYAEIKRTVPLREGNLELLNYCYPEHLGEWDWQQTEVMNMLQYFDSLFVPYPFMREKYGHAQFSWGGGMEHQTMSFMADLGPWLTSHELAHMWFGDMITCASWEDIWLNEGFATYLTGLFFERFSNPFFTIWKQNTIHEICSQPGGSVMVNDTLSVERIFDGRLSYYKGAMLLHMLRKKLGDAVFFEGLQTYLSRPDLRFGFANTVDFRETIQEVSGIDLQRFFNDWYAGAGYPNINIQYTISDFQVALNITQQGSTSDNPVFETRVPLRFIGDGDSLDISIEIDQALTQHRQQLNFKPLYLKVDPESDFVARYTLQKTESIEEWTPYPNPLRGDTELTIPNFGSALTIELFSSDGKQVYFYELTDAATLNLKKLPGGIYFIKLTTDNYSGISRKIIVLD
jgi:aminopeptidase N